MAIPKIDVETKRDAPNALLMTIHLKTVMKIKPHVTTARETTIVAPNNAKFSNMNKKLLLYKVKTESLETRPNFSFSKITLPS